MPYRPRIPKVGINQQTIDDARSFIAGLKGATFDLNDEPSVMDPAYERLQSAKDTGFLASLASGIPIPASATKLGALALAGVIKPKGGNWIPNSVNRIIEGLKKNPEAENYLQRLNVTPEELTGWADQNAARQFAESRNSLTQQSALNQWLEGPLRKYMMRDMASPDDPIRKLADRNYDAAVKQRDIDYREADKSSAHAEKLLQEGPRPDMPAGTWEAAVQRAKNNAERLRADANTVFQRNVDNVLHYKPRTEQDLLESADWVRKEQRDEGFIGEQLGQSDPAKLWEAHTDILLEPHHVGQGQMSPVIGRHSAQNPWLIPLAQRPEQSQVFGAMDEGLEEILPQELGFEHLVDELSNALNPESGLPRNLLLRPEQMQQMSIDKAVQRVADINKHRAIEMEKARIADSADIPVHKEYPEGMKWVELRARTPEEGGWEKMPDGWSRPSKNMPGFHDTSKDNPTEKELKKWLKDEGDTMGHCVGGYCPDVMEGRSRIFSLRDPAGNPHVTIETKNRGDLIDLDDEEAIDWIYNRQIELFKQDHPKVAAKNLTNDQIDQKYSDEMDDYYHRATEEYVDTGPLPKGEFIKQIKGKLNRKPVDRYIPYVQDFVKSGKWFDVKDFHNTDLIKAGKNYYTKAELDALAKDLKNPNHQDYLDYVDELNKKQGFAEGGLVTPKAMLNRLISAYQSV